MIPTVNCSGCIQVKVQVIFEPRLYKPQEELTLYLTSSIVSQTKACKLMFGQNYFRQIMTFTQKRNWKRKQNSSLCKVMLDKSKCNDFHI